MSKQGIKDVGRISQMFEDADADKNGKIEWTEFLEFTKAMKAGGKVKPREKKNISKKTSKLTNEMRREILRMFHSMVSQFSLKCSAGPNILFRIRMETGLWTVKSSRTI